MSRPWTPIQLQRTNGQAPIVLICEHASPYIPDDFDFPGIGKIDPSSHAVWDIGALRMAQSLSTELDAPLVSCGTSRSLYACNRPFSAKDCIPAKSEEIAFPGNEQLTEHARKTRRRLIHDLFHSAVEGLIENQVERVDSPVAVITLHSFTPVYYGRPREVEIGFLYHGNPTLSEAACRVERINDRYNVALNAPYGKEDGVTYSICRHADSTRLHSTMIEVRNDLIRTDDQAANMGCHLASTLREAIAHLDKTRAA